mgnify:CR=1 FL=1
MKPEPKQTPPTSVSRRTGLDRRWIPSPDHQPERRSGVDRRQSQQQPPDSDSESEASPADASAGKPHLLRLPAIGAKQKAG